MNIFKGWVLFTDDDAQNAARGASFGQHYGNAEANRDWLRNSFDGPSAVFGSEFAPADTNRDLRACCASAA